MRGTDQSHTVVAELSAGRGDPCARLQQSGLPVRPLTVEDRDFHCLPLMVECNRTVGRLEGFRHVAK